MPVGVNKLNSKNFSLWNYSKDYQNRFVDNAIVLFQHRSVIPGRCKDTLSLGIKFVKKNLSHIPI